MTEIVRFEIPGEPRTKKNSQRILTNGSKRWIAQSETYKDYENTAGWFVPAMRIDYPINLKVLYYRSTKRKVDLVNLLEATCDICERYELIRGDDVSIVKGHDGSRVYYDKENPRAVVIVERWEEDEQKGDKMTEEEIKELFMKIAVEVYDELWGLGVSEDGKIWSHTSKKEIVRAVWRLKKLLYDTGVAKAITEIRHELLVTDSGMVNPEFKLTNLTLVEREEDGEID